MLIIVPLTVLLIFIILYAMYKSVKWALVDSGHCRHGPHRRIAGDCWSRTPTSASPRALAFWRSSVSLCRPA